MLYNSLIILLGIYMRDKYNRCINFIYFFYKVWERKLWELQRIFKGNKKQISCKYKVVNLQVWGYDGYNGSY